MDDALRNSAEALGNPCSAVGCGVGDGHKTKGECARFVAHSRKEEKLTGCVEGHLRKISQCGEAEELSSCLAPHREDRPLETQRAEQLHKLIQQPEKACYSEEDFRGWDKESGKWPSEFEYDINWGNPAAIEKEAGLTRGR